MNLSLAMPRTDDQVGWGVLVSLGIHLLIIAVLVFWPGWHTRHQLFAPTYNVNLVGAPKFAPPAAPAPPAPKPQAKPAPKPEPKPQPVAKPKPKPAPKPKEAIATKPEKTKRIERKEKPKPQVNPEADLDKKIARMQREVSTERRLESALDKVERRVSNRSVGAGAAVAGSGQPSALEAMRYQVYNTELWQRIRSNWVVPEAMIQNPKGMMAAVVIRIRRDGSLEKAWLERSSGNTRFDASALRAVERGAPYPPLLPSMRMSVYEVGVRFSDSGQVG